MEGETDMKKFLAVIIIFSMLFVGTGAFSVSANSSTVITPYWLNVTSVIGVVGYNDSGTVGTVSISINGVASVSRITATIMLYYKNSTGNWIEIPEVFDNYDVNSRTIAINETFDATPGTEYKVELEAHVYANGITEIVTKEFT